MLIIFTSSALLVVALVVLAGAVDQMWILAPIMLVDFAVTAAVLVTVAKLLQDSSRDERARLQAAVSAPSRAAARASTLRADTQTGSSKTLGQALVPA